MANRGDFDLEKRWHFQGALNQASSKTIGRIEFIRYDFQEIILLEYSFAIIEVLSFVCTALYLSRVFTIGLYL